MTKYQYVSTLDDKYANYIKKIENAKVSRNYGNKEITIEENKEIYLKLLEKMSDNNFSERKSSIQSVVATGKVKFDDLSINEQCEIILQIVKWFGNISSGVDLYSIGGYKSTGTCRINKKITNANEFKLIFTSITGIYENIVDALKL